MNLFGAEDRLAIEQLAIRLQSVDSCASLEDYVIHDLPPLLGAAFASWNEHDSKMRLVRVATSRSHEGRVAPLVDALNKSLPTHPLFSKYLSSPDGVVRYVDTVDRTRAAVTDDGFRELPFYRDVASRLGIEDQLVMHIYVRGGRGIIATFHGERKFRETEHLKAILMRSHLVARLHAIERSSRKLFAMKGETESRLRTKVSPRELEVLRLVCRGHSNDSIAVELGVSRRTAENHVASLLRKLSAESRFKLISTYGNWI